MESSDTFIDLIAYMSAHPSGVVYVYVRGVVGLTMHISRPSVAALLVLGPRTVCIAVH